MYTLFFHSVTFLTFSCSPQAPWKCNPFLAEAMSWTSLEPRSDCLFLGLVMENEKQGYGGLIELQRKSFCVLSIEWLNLIYQRQEEVVAITAVRQLAQTLSAYPSCYCPPLWRHTDRAIKILVLNFSPFILYLPLVAGLFDSQTPGAILEPLSPANCLDFFPVISG